MRPVLGNELCVRRHVEVAKEVVERRTPGVYRRIVSACCVAAPTTAGCSHGPLLRARRIIVFIVRDAIDFRDKRPETVEQHPKYWQEHRRVVAQQIAEWTRLNIQFPNASFAIAGDWNTDLLAGTKLVRYPYGLTAQVEQITTCLDQLGLQIPTRQFPDPGKQRDWLIDHIAVPKGQTRVTALTAITDDESTLSDHPLVYVDWTL